MNQKLLDFEFNSQTASLKNFFLSFVLKHWELKTFSLLAPLTAGFVCLVYLTFDHYLFSKDLNHSKHLKLSWNSNVNQNKYYCFHWLARDTPSQSFWSALTWCCHHYLNLEWLFKGVSTLSIPIFIIDSKLSHFCHHFAFAAKEPWTQSS